MAVFLLRRLWVGWVPGCGLISWPISTCVGWYNIALWAAWGFGVMTASVDLLWMGFYFWCWGAGTWLVVDWLVWAGSFAGVWWE